MKTGSELIAPPRVKCLTICQPWAWAIINAPPEHAKRTENRTWYCHHRGPLLIHAGKSRAWLYDDPEDWYDEYGFLCPTNEELVFGAIIGVVDMVDCLPPDFPTIANHPFAEGPWCHVYDNVQAFDVPIPYRGAQGLFDVPRQVVAAEIDRLQRLTKQEGE